jgi:hypothetical protein
MRVLVVLVLTFLLNLTPGAAQGPDRIRFYDVEMRLFEGDRLFASPKITMREGGVTIMTVDRPGGYSMRVGLNRWMGNGGSPAAAERLKVSAEVHLRRDESWVLAATPEIIVPVGRPASIEVTPGQGAGGQTLRITVMVTGKAGFVPAAASKRCSAAREAQWRQAMASPAAPAVRLAQISPRTPCCSSGCVNCCGEQACCCESTQCSACCCTR